MYTTGTVAKLLGVSRETIRKWSNADKFGGFMSAGATPAENINRQFNDDDVRIFAYIHKSKQIGLSEDEIAAGLETGQRADLDEDIKTIVPASDRKQLSILQRQITEMKQSLLDAQAQHVKDETRIEFLEQHLTEAREEIKRLNREIGRLEARIDDEEN